jgi:hypothetical protein
MAQFFKVGSEQRGFRDSATEHLNKPLGAQSKVKDMKTNGESDYYLSRIGKYWKQLGRLFQSSRKILPNYLDAALAEKVEDETYNEFKIVLTKLPYIGGDENMLTFTFVSSAAALAYMRVLERYGLPVETIGVILNKVYGDVYASLPEIVKWWLRWSEFSSSHRNKLKAFAKDTQLRKYPENWVMDYVEGDGIEFDIGCSYTECAVLKYYQKMGAEKYMPYVCVMDLTASNALRTGLNRTTTIYYGGSCCDFQYKKNRPSMSGLPLENLPEYRNRIT